MGGCILAGLVYGVVHLVVGLEVSAAARQHVNMEVRHRLARCRTVLRKLCASRSLQCVELLLGGGPHGVDSPLPCRPWQQRWLAQLLSSYQGDSLVVYLVTCIVRVKESAL